MTEILTESFCERCGTRYTFETKAAGSGRARGFRTLSAGLKNFVLSDDTSLGDAMAAARSEQDREVTNQQLDAFHKTFNFCMQCRQYTCANCWNEADGFCLTCAPHLGHDILEAPFPTAQSAIAPAPEAERPTISAEAWPALDLPAHTEVPSADAAPSHAVPEPEPVAEVVAEAGPEWVEPEFAPAAGREDTLPEDVAATAAADVAAAATAETRSLFGRFRAGQNLDTEIGTYEGDAVAAPEEEVAAGAAPAVPEPADAAAPPWTEVESIGTEAIVLATEPVAAEPGAAPFEPAQAEGAVEPEAVQDEAEAAPVFGEPEPEPWIAAEPVAEPAPEPGPWIAAGAPSTAEAEAEAPPSVARPAEDVVAQPVWRIVAPDEPGPSVPAPSGQPVAPPTVLPSATGEPQWPTASADRLEFLRRPARDVWTASTQDLLARAPTPEPGSGAPVAIQACTSCGLSLSATARFCRRCGTRQG